MTDTIKSTILKAEKLAIKYKKKVKRNDIDFRIQVSLSSADPGVIYYALQFTSLAEGVAPVTFLKANAEEFIEAIEAQLKIIDDTAVEVAYHEAQIYHAKRNIKFHEERIEEITKGDEDVEEQKV